MLRIKCDLILFILLGQTQRSSSTPNTSSDHSLKTKTNPNAALIITTHNSKSNVSYNSGPNLITNPTCRSHTKLICTVSSILNISLDVTKFVTLLSAWTLYPNPKSLISLDQPLILILKLNPSLTKIGRLTLTLTTKLSPNLNSQPITSFKRKLQINMNTVPNSKLTPNPTSKN